MTRFAKMMTVGCALILMLALTACGDDDDDASSDTAGTDTEMADTGGGEGGSGDDASMEEWSLEAAVVCSEFSDGFTEGSWAGPVPYTNAAKALSELDLPAEKPAEALVLAMTEAAAAHEAFSAGLDQHVGQGETWYLTEDGTLWVHPTDEVWFKSSTPADMPEELGAALFAAEDELTRTAEAVGLDDCTPGGVEDSAEQGATPSSSAPE